VNAVYWLAECMSSFIEAFACFIFCGTFINREKVSEKKYTILLLSAASAGVATLFNTITLFSGVTTVLSVVILLVTQFIVYRKPLKCLIFVIAFFAIIAAVDLSVGYSISYMTGLSVSEVALEHTNARLMALIFSKALLILVVSAVYKLTVKKPSIPKRYIVAMLAFSVIAFAMSSFFLLREIYSETEALSTFSVLFAVLSLLFVVVVFFGIIKLAEHYANKQQSSLLALRNQMLEESHKETEETFSLWQSSLHDFKHNLAYLMSLAESGDTDKIKDYIAKENELLAQRLFYYKTGNNAVDAIVNVKQALAHDKGITFQINAVVPAECRVSDSHLCAVLGNLIDNAINASEPLTGGDVESYVKVNIKQAKDFLVIKIVNSFDESLKKTYSKEEQAFHGIGLKSVRRIISDYDGKFKTTIDGDTFTAEAMIQL
jgi:sensor histidine kinase YesM